MTFNGNLTLTFWRNENDPGKGNFFFEQAQRGYLNKYRIKNQSQLYWESGELHSTEMPQVLLHLLEGGKNFSLEKNSSLSIPIYPSLDNLGKIRLLMNYSGEILLLKWEEEVQWLKLWWRPYDVCDIHNYCGSFSTCNKNNWKQCSCLQGFSPRLSGHEYIEERFLGCVRKSPITCSTVKNDTFFIHLTNTSLENPDSKILTKSELECQSSCLTHPHCQCQAYSFYNASSEYNKSGLHSCWIWTHDLPMLQENQVHGRNLSILVKSSGNLIMY